MIGVYFIKNLINDKVYVGSSQDIERRFYLHKHYLNKGKHINQHLQNAWNEYGEENFSFSILEQIDNIEQLLEKEKECIIHYNSINREFGYNICEDTTAPMVGRKHSEFSKQKMIQSKLGDKNSFYGKHHTDKTKSILREQMRGRKLGDSHKQKVLQTSCQNGELNMNSKLTNEIAQKIREEFNTYKSKYGTYKILSEKYGVHHDTVRRIVKNKTYKQ
jgi:group I intron endonuclease